MTEDKRPTLSLKRKPGEKTPESGADTARVVRRKQVVNVTTPPAWKVKKEKLAIKTEPVAPAVAAMNLLVNAGIPVRTVSQFKIMHDKVIITDGRNVETGSFNFSRAAARSNSENALVIRDYPVLANTYLQHWQTRWEMGKDWSSSY
ncbi:phospholipase D-like domain-containing protein [Enterobacter cloacae complex sp. BZL2004]|uniref:phospholipase D-like domain-containing protein n=1 Tax=Enterobacter cloacae complex sp. BZL2004 TaxID=3412325 RepID=UPI003BA4A243